MYLWCEIAVYLPCEWITVKIRWSQYNASLPPWTNNVMIALQRGKDWFGTGSISLPIFILDSDNIHHIKCWNIYIQAIFLIPDGKIYIFRQYLKYQMSKYFYQIHIVYWYAPTMNTVFMQIMDTVCLWGKIGVIWGPKIHLKSYNTALGFCLWIDMI